MYFEKLGFMLIFWNMAGVPLSYCHCSIYLANHAPSVYHWSRPALAVFFISYLFVYWVWDTANSQKNQFRHEERGTLKFRNTFPQLPWRHIKNPKTIKTSTDDSLFVDGWCTYFSSSVYQYRNTKQSQMRTRARFTIPVTCSLP